MRTCAIRESWEIPPPSFSGGYFGRGALGHVAVGLLFLSGLLGCAVVEEEPEPEPVRLAPPLRVLVVDDPGLGDAITRQWRARAETQIELVEATVDELLDTQQAGIAADAVIYPSGLLGELAERRRIAPFSAREVNSPEFGRRDIFDLIRQQEIVWGRQVFAVPLGSPVLTLIYRRDLFDALDLKPPETWEAYQQIAEILADPAIWETLNQRPPQDWSGVVEPLGAGWASQVLLARAAAYARHRNYFSSLFDSETMEALIAGPPFVRALEEMVRATGAAGPSMLNYDPQQALQTLLDGRSALCIAWPSAAYDPAEPESTPPAHIGYSELPGSPDVYNPSRNQWQRRERTEGQHATLLGVAGRVGSVSSSSRQPQAAVSLLINLASTDWSEQISPHSPATTLFRQSQRVRVGNWLGREVDAATARQYAEVVQQSHRRSLWLSLRIPGRARYLEALDHAIGQVIRGEEAPADALSQAAHVWDEVTSDMGVERQRVAYWRSQGMEP